ncbi:zinc finger protein ZFP2-like isoform X6 [Onthophagus taurus]|uniref:zinc finger protein ZFP2-like isoform X6 n=1 Tax=Onthophagus taurus TaxID=166361 RepID=UPI0039BDB3F4
MMGTMSSIKEIMQFCRLCLVKDQVNVSIFEEHGDTRDVKRKISECLPVTVSEEDSLPKKICDGCLYKLELLYQFRTTCVSAEKQLQVWIAELNNSESKEDQDLKLQHSQTSVKEEIFDATDHPDNSEYVIEEQHISYEEGDIPYNESQDDNDDGDATNSSDDEPLAKRRKRFLEEQVQTDDTLKTADNKMAITKLEHESDDENVDDPEPNFVSVGTSDDQQPGPSGLNKMSATTTNAEMPKRKHRWNKDIKRKPFLMCKNCNEKFSTARQLSIHTKEHLQKSNERQYLYTYSNRMFNCNTCDAEFSSKEKVEDHVLTHEKQYECVKCHSVFESPYKYSVHVQKHTKEAFQCPLCHYKTARATSLSQHINRMHLKRYAYNCRHCGKGFGDPSVYKEHEQNHIAVKTLVCIVCKKEFLFSRYLTQHQTKRHVPNILGIQRKDQCAFCKKIFKKQATLDKHLQTFHSNTPRPTTHLCDNCGKGFKTKHQLTLHYRIHTGYKPYQCKYCDKCFSKKEYLVMHERIHSGEKPYSCTHCGKCFNQYSSLRVHVRTHTGERPYVCQFCGNGYATKHSLKIHMNTCSGPDNKD